MMSKRVELFAGMLAGAAGITAIAYAVFGPTGTVQVCTGIGAAQRCTSTTQSTWQQGLEPGAVGLILAALFLFIVVAVSAYLHAQYGARRALAALWIATLLLIAGGVVAILSVGIFILLPAALALIAATVGSISGPEPAGRTRSAA